MDNRPNRVDADNKQQSQPNPSPAELQQRLHQTRESITQTVAEIKSTMHTQYNTAKDRATENLDWKLQMRKYPVAACLGALAVGYLAGRTLGQSVDDDDDDHMVGSGHDYTAMHGSQLAPSSSASSRGITQKILPPQTRARMASRVEDVIGNLAEQFLGELTRVGRDVVVPSLVGALTSKLNNAMPGTSGSAQSTGHSNVGGTGNFGGQGSGTGSYQGRSI